MKQVETPAPDDGALSRHDTAILPRVAVKKAEEPPAETASDTILLDAAPLESRLASPAPEEPVPDDTADAAVAVNAADVFANMDSFDDGGLDDEMRALLADGDAPPEDAASPPAAPGPDPFVAAVSPSFARRVVGRARGWWRRGMAAAAFRENWWLYCDLLAVFIVTVSLAVIVAWYKWHR